MILLLGSGCEKTETGTNQNVEIGALLSLTGNWSSLGITSQEAINLAITDVNAFMLQKGNNLKFSATFLETKLEAALAKDAINAGLAKKIKYFIGPQSSAELAAVKPIADANNFIAPNFGLPSLANPDLARITAAIQSKTNLVPDAYALAAYDAVWVIARTVESMRSSGNDYTTVKNIFKAESGKFFGITGQTILNQAGDRSQGAFDYWGIGLENGKFKWILKGKSS